MTESRATTLKTFAIVLALATQLSALVWGAATMSSSVDRLEEKLSENSTETRQALRDMAVSIKELARQANQQESRINVIEDRQRRRP